MCSCQTPEVIIIVLGLSRHHKPQLEISHRGWLLMTPLMTH
jgi:hypothetical protein